MKSLKQELNEVFPVIAESQNSFKDWAISQFQTHNNNLSSLADAVASLGGDVEGHTHTWNEITNKPTSFNPSSHTHPISQITNLQTTLNNKANISDLPTKVGELENDEGYITEEDIVIGGRNMTLGTSQQLVTGVTAEDTGTSASVITIADFGHHTFEANTDYTISFNLAVEEGATLIHYNYLWGTDGKGNTSIGSITVVDDGLFRRYKKTFSFTTERTGTIRIAFDSRRGEVNSGVEYSIHSLKLEKGTIATDWSPAPEDKADVDHTHNWRDLQDENNISIQSYVDSQDTSILQQANNHAANNYVPLEGSTTKNGTLTLTSPPVIPNATLNSHAVNRGYADGRYASISRTISTGTGLTGGGDLSVNRTLSIGSSTMNKINNAYNWGNHANAGYALASRTITAGTGLTGGGNLTLNRTINFDTSWGDSRYALQGGTYSNLRAQATTKADVGLSNVPNWSGSTSTSLGTSNTTIPSQGAVKSYVDSGLSGKANTSGTYSGLRAQATTKSDVGLGNVRNVASYSQTEARTRFYDIHTATGYLPTAITDLNDLEAGQRGLARDEANTPPGSSFSDVVTISQYGSSDLLQIVYPFRNDNKFYLRNKYGSSWGDWIRVWHSGILDPVTTNTNQIITGRKQFDQVVYAPQGFAQLVAPSLRSLKENIKPFKTSGIELINQLDISTFDYKDIEEEGEIIEGVKDSIGIIADDSPDEFLNSERKAVDLYKTVFIQAKAIQELTHENNVLKEKIETLEDRLNRLEKLMKDK